MDKIATFLESWESCFKQLFTFYDKYQRSSGREKLTRDNEMMRKTTKQIGDLFERASERAEKTKGKAINRDLHEHPQQLVSSPEHDPQAQIQALQRELHEACEAL